MKIAMGRSTAMIQIAMQASIAKAVAIMMAFAKKAKIAIIALMTVIVKVRAGPAGDIAVVMESWRDRKATAVVTVISSMLKT
jgi:hypothetical protein